MVVYYNIVNYNILICKTKSWQRDPCPLTLVPRSTRSSKTTIITCKDSQVAISKPLVKLKMVSWVKPLWVVLTKWGMLDLSLLINSRSLSTQLSPLSSNSNLTHRQFSKISNKQSQVSYNIHPLIVQEDQPVALMQELEQRSTHSLLANQG
jgi:hypothetical protein